MLQLDRGRAMRYLVDKLEHRRFTWAYRVVDSRAFGLPQRRQRVILIASKTEDPRQALLAEDAGARDRIPTPNSLFGFYWTEGTRGLGWAVDEVPTLKGGSSIGIPSPPAIWDPERDTLSTPEIRDAERLQGFDPEWTVPSLEAVGVRPGHRWKLVGNAVSVPVATWIGRRLSIPGKSRPAIGKLLARGLPWPKAAWGHNGKVFAVDASMWPTREERPRLGDFLQFPQRPLSARAAGGFLTRASASSLFFEPGFLECVRRHTQRMDLARAI
jgi:DNA (cytosine-5)-methyltransferase 1